MVAPPAGEFVFSLGSLYDYLTKLTDRRKRRGVRYPLATILVLVVLAKLCGQDKPYGIADWAQQRRSFLAEALRLKRGRLPHHSTYRRIFESVVNGDELERLLSEFVSQQPLAGQEVVIAIDGKTLRGTITPCPDCAWSRAILSTAGPRRRKASARRASAAGAA